MSKYFIEDETLHAIADAIRLKRDTVEQINPEDMPMEIGLIESGGGGLPLQLDLIGEQTIYLPEYTNTTTEESTTTSINISGTNYAYIITTIYCDGDPTGGANDWGGTTVALGGRYTSNKCYAQGTSGLTYRGSKVVTFDQAVSGSAVPSGYGVGLKYNTAQITISRKCHSSAMPKIMGGNYTIRAYGIVGM